MKRIFLIICVLITLFSLFACRQTDTELYINSEFSEVTMKTIYGESRNVAKAIEDGIFATEDTNAVSFILPDKWQEYKTDMQIQRIEGGMGVYTLANDYTLSSIDYKPCYADLFAIIYVTKDESEALLLKYAEYFSENEYLGYMDDKVCYLLYNKEINTQISTEFTSDECEYWEKFLNTVTKINTNILLCAQE